MSGEKHKDFAAGSMLAESLACHNYLFHHSSEAVIICSPEGAIVDVNIGACDWLGYTREEFLRRTIMSLQYSNPASDYLDRIKEVFQFGILVLESDVCTSDGTPIHVEIIAQSIDHAGQPALFNTIRDIGGRKTAEHDMQRSVQYNRSLIDTMPDPVFIVSAGGIVTDANESAVALVGADKDELIGTSFSAYFTNPATAATFCRQVLSGGGRRSVELRVRHAEGGTIILQCNATTFRLPGNTGESVLVAGRDVTELGRVRYALERTERRSRKTLETSPEAIMVTDADGHFIQVNQNTARLFGFQKMSDLHKSGLTIFQLIAEFDQQRAKEHLYRCLVSGRIRDVRYTGRRVNGEEFPLEVSTSLLMESDGDPMEFVTVARDITSWKKAETEMRHALEKEQELHALKTRFVSMTSHEFRTPLTTIITSSDMLLRYAAKWSGEKKEIHLKRILESGERMTDLLNDILVLGRAEAGKTSCKPLPMDVIQWCRNLADEFQLTAREGQHIRCEFPEQMPPAVMDEKLLRHILGNLLSNALKYSPEGTPVEFGIDVADNSVLFRITDKGIGIPEEDQVHLFESFHRADNVGSIQGTGLGLTIVKKSVETCGGTISVKSTVNVGTAFTVHLPLRATADAQ